MKRFFVHRYKHRHDKRREIAKDACRYGEITLINQSCKGWLYEAPDDYNPEKRKIRKRKGGTDTTTKDFLLDIPGGVSIIENDQVADKMQAITESAYSE
jgi:hypothetical protein